MSDSRQRFEAWVKEGKKFHLKVDVHGEYVNHTTRMQWVGWQACEAQYEQVGEIVDIAADGCPPMAGRKFHKQFEADDIGTPLFALKDTP